MFDFVKKSLLTAAMLAAALLLQSCASQGGKAESESADPRSSMEKAYGIKIDSVRLSAANYMMTFKFTVIDPDKAVPLMDHKLDPTIIQERTGSKFAVPFSPKIGALRSAPKFSVAGRNYYIIFGNPGGFVKSGDLITIVIGDFMAEHITVL